MSKDLWGQLELLGRLDQLGFQARRVRQEPMEPRAYRETLEFKEPQVNKETKVSLVLEVHQERKDLLDPRDFEETLDLLARGAQQALLERLEPRGREGYVETLGMWALQARLGTQDSAALMDHKALLERKVTLVRQQEVGQWSRAWKAAGAHDQT